VIKGLTNPFSRPCRRGIPGRQRGRRIQTRCRAATRSTDTTGRRQADRLAGPGTTTEPAGLQGKAAKTQARAGACPANPSYLELTKVLRTEEGTRKKSATDLFCGTGSISVISHRRTVNGQSS